MLTCLAPRPAQAGETPAAAPRGALAWKPSWHRFTTNEAAFVTALTVGAYILDRKLPDYPTPNMDFELPLVDPGVRHLVRADTSEDQRTWARLSDIGFRAMVLFPYVVDAGVVALGVQRNADVAAQLLLIDLEAFTLAGILQLATSRLTSRTRPFVDECADDDRGPSRRCGDTREHRSLYGGHASAAFTSAGLTCLHHQHLPLYGGGAPDQWACVWAVTFASFVAAARIAADEHWASDTAVGIGTGWLFGYVLPKWLHYGSPREGPRSLLRSVLSPRSGFRWSPSFQPVADGGTLNVQARF